VEYLVGLGRLPRITRAVAARSARAAGTARERPEKPYPALHLGRVVEARERFVRFFDAEELTQGSPALLKLVDQQRLLRDALPDLLIVALEELYRVGTVLEPTVEDALPDDLVDHPADP